MIRLLSLLLIFSLIVSPLAGGHAVSSDGGGGGFSDTGMSLHADPHHTAQCSGDHDQDAPTCWDFMMGCNAALMLRKTELVKVDELVIAGQFQLNSDLRDGIEFDADPPPPRS
jgi:hypothetical protein